MFRCHRKDNSDKAAQYMDGLFQARKRNMERMEEVVDGSNYESLQQFISSSPWSARAVMDRIAQETDGVLGGLPGSALVLDESAFAKKGDKSVGVARQYDGRHGKVDNCQVAVFGSLVAGGRYGLVDARLFLPSGWAGDPERCREAGVPEEFIVAKSKVDLALDIVIHQRELGVRFSFVCADGLYGNSGGFLRGLDDLGETFMVHVHSDQMVYLSDPKPAVPEGGGRGRPPTQLKAQVEAVTAASLAQKLRKQQFKRVPVRMSTTGPLERLAWRRKVWLWDGEEGVAREWTLLVVKEYTGEIKYCLTNADPETPLCQLVGMEAARFWIERGFEDCKSTVGMAEYQIRGWRGWHHHMAMSMLALLFMLKQRIAYGNTCPLLSPNDIRSMLCALLPRRGVTFSEVVRQMWKRHKKRKAAAESKARVAAARRESA
jgi:SRSO17 transposase